MRKAIAFSESSPESSSTSQKFPSTVPGWSVASRNARTSSRIQTALLMAGASVLLTLLFTAGPINRFVNNVPAKSTGAVMASSKLSYCERNTSSGSEERRSITLTYIPFNLMYRAIHSNVCNPDSSASSFRALDGRENLGEKFEQESRQEMWVANFFVTKTLAGLAPLFWHVQHLHDSTGEMEGICYSLALKYIYSLQVLPFDYLMQSYS